MAALQGGLSATGTLHGVADSPNASSRHGPLLADPEFADVTEQEWAAAVQSTLRGKSLRSLRTTLLDGIETEPLYTTERDLVGGSAAGWPGAAPFVRGATASSGLGWQVRQTHDIHQHDSGQRDSQTPNSGQGDSGLSDSNQGHSRQGDSRLGHRRLGDSRLAAGDRQGVLEAIAADVVSGVDAITLARGWDVHDDAAALAAAVGEAAAAGVAIHLQAGASRAHADALTKALGDHGIDPGAVGSWLGLDPIAAAISGVSTAPAAADASEPDATFEPDDSFERAGVDAAELARRWPGVVPCAADGSVLADAGACDTTELGAVLATAVAWLRRLCDAPGGPGLDPATAAGLIGFTIAAGPDPFLVTAKCRALRLCWARILQACGAAPGPNADPLTDTTAGPPTTASPVNRTADTSAQPRTGTTADLPPGAARTPVARPGAQQRADSSAGLPLRLHAVTSTAMLSEIDPWVNIVRATAACFGAANGGVDAITVRPFDIVGAGNASSPLGWRIAANTQLILRHESRIGTVIDPAGGSGYVEALTRSVAAVAWERFVRIEAAGGICDALASGDLAASAADDRARRDHQRDHQPDHQTATGHQVLAGVTGGPAQDRAARP